MKNLCISNGISMSWYIDQSPSNNFTGRDPRQMKNWYSPIKKGVIFSPEIFLAGIPDKSKNASPLNNFALAGVLDGVYKVVVFWGWLPNLLDEIFRYLHSGTYQFSKWSNLSFPFLSSRFLMKRLYFEEGPRNSRWPSFHFCK